MMKETKKDKWIKYWNKRADESSGYFQCDYKNISSFENTKNTMLQMVDGLSGKIIDIGCGSGIHSVLFAKKGFITYGVDFSLKMIHEAIKYSKQEQINAHFLVAEGGNIPFKSEKFDIVALIGVLQYNKYPERLIKECHRILKNNGKLVITTLNKNSPLRLKGEIIDILRRISNSKKMPLKRYTISSLTKMLINEGYKEIRFFGISISPVSKPRIIRCFFEKIFKNPTLAPSFAIEVTKKKLKR